VPDLAVRRLLRVMSVVLAMSAESPVYLTVRKDLQCSEPMLSLEPGGSAVTSGAGSRNAGLASSVIRP
jgi:hypothetical protein